MDRALRDPIERALAPLDRARVWLLRGAMPVSSRLAGARELRVMVVGLAAVSLSLLGAVFAPLWLLALGPIVLGVPHILADVRYCVVRPGLHRIRGMWLVAGLPLVLLSFGAPLEIGLVGVAASVIALPDGAQASGAGAGQPGQGSSARRWVVVGLALGLAGLARWVGPTADLVFAHAHNFIAVGLWAVWRERSDRRHGLVLVAFGLGCVALLAGAADFTWAHGLSVGLPTSLSAQTHLASLAPAVAAPWGLRLVLLYCFAQSVHYSVWLRLVPEDDRDRPTPRTFRASYRALRDELSAPLLGLFGLAAVGLAIGACVDLALARYGYLRFVRFHGTLELGALALVFVRGSRR